MKGTQALGTGLALLLGAAALPACLDPDPIEVGPSGPPCALSVATSLDFGLVPPGQRAEQPLQVSASCPQTLTEVSVSGRGFSLARSVLPLPLNSATPPLLVAFTPSTVGATTGAVRLVTRDGRTAVVALRGEGHPCRPEIVIAGGAAIEPFAPVDLDAVQPAPCAQDLTSWRWQLRPPAGPIRVSDEPVVRLDPDVVGPWRIRLEADGALGAVTSETTIDVVPTRRIHLELTWQLASGAGGPGEPESSAATPVGPDLDLHFLHPFAVGRDIDGDEVPDGWFDVPFDVHWNNPTPAWGLAGVADDDGRLDRDDHDGPGPEVVSLDDCGGLDGFELGVHAFDDHAFGPAIARVRVYFEKRPIFDRTAELAAGDFWEVGRLRCAGVVESHRTDSGERLVPGVFVPAPAP